MVLHTFNEAHINVRHLGISSTLTKVRMAGYWIPKSRQAVKNVISPCLMCKRFNSLSFRYPKITKLRFLQPNIKISQQDG